MEEEIRTFIRGMNVVVPKKLKFTKKKYSINETMKSFIGSSKKITEIYDDGNFRMASWSWDKRDFIYTSPPKKIPIAHFDPDELIT